MTRIVTYVHRYKRAPRKRRPKPAALAMPKIVVAKTPKPRKPGDPPIRLWRTEASGGTSANGSAEPRSRRNPSGLLDE
jgi:hypothetical protein